MITLMDFIKNVENEVFERVDYITKFRKDVLLSEIIWVHQLKGKVVTENSPSQIGFVHKHVSSLCILDRELRWIPDKKAINKWIEEEVLLHPSSVTPRCRKQAPIKGPIFL